MPNRTVGYCKYCQEKIKCVAGTWKRVVVYDYNDSWDCSAVGGPHEPR